MQVSFVVTAENLADKPVALQLADRIPVSETEEVRVIGVRIQPEVVPDAKGVLRWEVSLAGREKKDFRVDYTLEYPKDLPQVTSESPAAGKIIEQINDLEKALK